MVLLINTAERNKIELGICKVNNFKKYFKETNRQSEELLLFVDEVLNKENIHLSELSSIFVCQGPGSYTGTRVGVTVANSLAWSLNIPVLGYPADKLDMEIVKKHKVKRFEKSVLPLY